MGASCSGKERNSSFEATINQYPPLNDAQKDNEDKVYEELKEIIETRSETSQAEQEPTTTNHKNMQNLEVVTLTRYLLTKKAAAYLKDSALEFALIFEQMQLAFLKISEIIQKSRCNIQERQSLVEQCCDMFEKVVQQSGQFCVIYCVKRDKIYMAEQPSASEKYVIMFSGLDNNIDPETNSGSLFVIWKRVTTKFRSLSEREDILQSCNTILAAGYCMYGQCIQLVFALGTDVNGFQYDPSLREFVLTHPKIKASQKSGTLSIDASRESLWEPHMKIFLGRKSQKKDNKQVFRFTGSLVADAHRTLLQGGILMFPLISTNSEGDISMIEAFALSYIFEKAWGRASRGEGGSLFQSKLVSLQQKTTFFCGSSAEIVELENLYLQIARRQSINKSIMSKLSSNVSSIQNSQDLSKSYQSMN